MVPVRCSEQHPHQPDSYRDERGVSKSARGLFPPLRQVSLNEMVGVGVGVAVGRCSRNNFLTCKVLHTGGTYTVFFPFCQNSISDKSNTCPISSRTQNKRDISSLHYNFLRSSQCCAPFQFPIAVWLKERVQASKRDEATFPD